MNTKQITNIEIDAYCSSCKNSFSVSIEELRRGEFFSCPRCQLRFDSKKLLRTVEDIEKNAGNIVRGTVSFKIWQILSILGLTVCVIGMLVLLYLQLTQGICIKISR